MIPICRRCFRSFVLFSVVGLLLLSQNAFAQEGAERAESGLATENQIFTTRPTPKMLPMPKEDGAFQIIVYGDRTGGEPAGLKYLRQAVEDTNLIDPDFVMTVGDLIQGYNRPAKWLEEMKEYREIMSKLNMEWFPVAGNHDIYWDFRDENRPRGHHESNYEKHFGPLWYSFKHKQQGFIVLFSDEGDLETGEKGFREGRMQNVSPQQMKFLEQALAKCADCNQVFVFLHHPRWLGGGYEGGNWPQVHQKLAAAGNVSAVFAGHIHHMTYQGPVDGIEYYTLGTTGGHLSMDSMELGYLHHFNIVTIRENEFSVSTLPVGTVMDPKTFKSDFLADVNRVRRMRPQRFAERLPIGLDGKVSGQYAINVPNPGQSIIEVTVSPEMTGGWKALPEHRHVVVQPGKTEKTNFYFYREANGNEAWESFSTPRMSMTVDYLHESARVRLPKVYFLVDLTLPNTISRDIFGSVRNRCLNLRGIQSRRTLRERNRITNDSVRINSNDASLPQGPFTLEAWINPTDLSRSRAVVAKTQSSEYALFLHEGKATFDVHLDGEYISSQSDSKLELNRWTHLAGVYDGHQVHLYVDGQRVKSLDGSGTRKTNHHPLYIGADPDGSGNPSREFAGQIDEVRLSQGVCYDGNFQPQKKFSRDKSTLLLLHFDEHIGPFVPSNSQDRILATMLGEATIIDSKH